MAKDTLTLIVAHPLTEDAARRVRATDVRSYQPGEKITLPKHEARALIGSGYGRLDGDKDGDKPASRTTASGAAGAAPGPSKS